MIKYPEFNTVAVALGPISIHWYGLMYLVAFAAAWFLARRRAASPHSTWNAQLVDDLIFFGMVGTILGGRIGYVLIYGLDNWRIDPWYPFKIWEGGMSFHGGLAGVLIAFAWFARSRRRRVADVFDFAAPLPGIGICAVRIGNFINSELWGKPTDASWGMQVTDHATGLARVLHPTQLYEATLEGVAMFMLLWWFTSRPRLRYAPTALFLVWYALARIAVEFLRQPDAQIGYLWGTEWVTMGMVLSLPLLTAGLWLAVLAVQRHESSDNYRTPA